VSRGQSRGGEQGSETLAQRDNIAVIANRQYFAVAPEGFPAGAEGVFGQRARRRGEIVAGEERFAAAPADVLRNASVVFPAAKRAGEVSEVHATGSPRKI
jgi:hypothetical protein